MLLHIDLSVYASKSRPTILEIATCLRRIGRPTPLLYFYPPPPSYHPPLRFTADTASSPPLHPPCTTSTTPAPHLHHTCTTPAQHLHNIYHTSPPSLSLCLPRLPQASHHLPEEVLLLRPRGGDVPVNQRHGAGPHHSGGGGVSDVALRYHWLK